MSKRITVFEDILSSNELIASKNKAMFDAAGVLSLNLMASPGAGKTSVIERTLFNLKSQMKVAVIDGDIATNLDADRAEAAGAIAVQINTGGQCHLDANMIQTALGKLDLSGIDLIIIENVGNLICPASFDLGVDQNILIASVPEGDDKPYKYPGMYRGVDILIINKTDLLTYLDFDLDYFCRGVESLNPNLTIFPVSCTTGEGIDAWIEWLSSEIAHKRLSTKKTVR